MLERKFDEDVAGGYVGCFCGVKSHFGRSLEQRGPMTGFLDSIVLQVGRRLAPHGDVAGSMDGLRVACLSMGVDFFMGEGKEMLRRSRERLESMTAVCGLLHFRATLAGRVVVSILCLGRKGAHLAGR